MSFKRIAVSMLVGAFALVALAGVSTAASPYDQPPTISLLKSNKRVKLKKNVIVGRARCGTGSCTVRGTAFAATRNSARFKAKFRGTAVPSGASKALLVRLPKATIAAIAGSKTGHGHIKVRATIRSTTGQSATRKGKVRFQAAKPKK